jgi:predicted CXXCH cytochrome family protein
MANASGAANQAVTPADFTHSKSGVHYRIYKEGEKVWLTFERQGDPTVQGKRELLYFIGSGRRGRSYLFSVDGFLFESPINWYSGQHVWDMAPAYGQSTEIPLDLPAYTSCLSCHVSGMQPPLAGTENRYPDPPFTHAGVTCERCHGPGASHLAGGAIVNPNKLTPAKRDSVCMECHLEGKVAVENSGKRAYEFRPGDDLSDYVSHFLLSSGPAGGLGAVSQFEALAQSVCKKKSGDSMTCTSCHDPHSSPAPAERVAYFRGKCLACHGTEFATRHFPKQPDCTGCHMPASMSKDIAHTEVTDHRILKRTTGFHLPPEPAGGHAQLSLVPFPPTDHHGSDIRDLGLAWEILDEQGLSGAEAKAEQYLASAAKADPNDTAVLSEFGYVEQKTGHIQQARSLYEKALAIDPNLVDAATNLGVIDAQSGDLQDAAKLLQGAFRLAPEKSDVGIDLARIFCAEGQMDNARAYIVQVLRFNPDLSTAKRMLHGLSANPPACEL